MPIWVICKITLIGLPLASFSLKAAVDFRSYCEIIAEKQGRLKEFQDFLSADENALNRFEREQFRKLMREISMLRTMNLFLLGTPTVESPEIAEVVDLSVCSRCWCGISCIVIRDDRLKTQSAPYPA
jgi:hypothetical protein